MSNQHTPGPWVQKGESHGNYISIGPRDGKTVARVPWGDGDAANASLIASAPELLAALEECLPLLRIKADGATSPGSMKACDRRLALAENAIAKAKGDL